MTADTAARRNLYNAFMDQKAGPDNVRLGNARRAVYAFFDFDREPIYIGQTVEKLSTRVGRHLTGQRSDAVVNRVLDPNEVAYIAVWPLWDLEGKSNAEAAPSVNSAERALYDKVIAESSIGRVLNEKEPPLATVDYGLPSESHFAKLVPDEIWDRLAHPDERIARRASKLAEQAAVVRDRQVSLGLRISLQTQSERFLRLAERRVDELRSVMSAEDVRRETVGSGPKDESLS